MLHRRDTSSSSSSRLLPCKGMISQGSVKMEENVGSFTDTSFKIEKKEEDYVLLHTKNYIDQSIKEGTASSCRINKKKVLRPFRNIISKHSSSKPILHVNRQRLGCILRKLALAHNWKEASGIVSVLLKSANGLLSFEENRKNMQAAMEVHKRFLAEGNYQIKIKKLYDVWMSKLGWSKDSSREGNLIQLELALFYFIQGSVHDAESITKFLLQDRDFSGDPKLNLIHGLILYQLWYSSLPDEIQIKSFDTLEAYNDASTDFCQETGTTTSSNCHYAVDGDVKFASQVASETSVGNDKNVTIVQRNLPQDTFNASEFCMSGSMHINEQMGASSHFGDESIVSSIFFARGLDKNLLPIQLKHLDGDLEQIIYYHRKLPNECYKDAVRHLRLALYSTPPLLAALQPLVQLLLLGDRVDEALKEVEKSCFCDVLNVAPLPFRLRARLMECFRSNNGFMISSCYENVLTRDPTCSYSLDRLIRINKTGNYSIMQLLEMIAIHLDAVGGKSGVWEELASCFLKLLNYGPCDYEDRVSSNVRCLKSTLLPNKVPKYFTEGQPRDTWSLRCRWWRTRHFSKSCFLYDMQLGDMNLLASKAASASHLYGQRFNYVTSVLDILLRDKGQCNLISFMHSHIPHSMKLHENLELLP